MIATLSNGKYDLKVRYDSTNVHIYDSCLVASSDMADWVHRIKELGELSGYKYLRSEKSWVREWKAHNFLFELDVERERTHDVDLNNNETFVRRFAYYLLSLLYV